jgi:DNA primase
MDELEKFIRNHRDELDKYSPEEKTWMRIKSALRKRPRSLIFTFSAAAVIVIVLGIAALFRMIDYRIPGSKRYEALVNNDPQIRETELYYDNLVNDLFREAMPMLTGYPDLEKELIIDLTQLDSICIEIKKDLKDNISNQEVIEALINNYRIKIHILNDMLDLLKQEENKTTKTTKHAL